MRASRVSSPASFRGGLFAGSAAYEDLTGEVVLVDGVWTVTREAYCGFLATARTPCR